MKKMSFVTIGLVVLLVSGSLASAAFVSGTEEFNGPYKDTSTWESYIGFYPDQGTISQNDALTVDATGGLNCDYTTKTLTVGVGDVVNVEVKPTVAEQWAGGGLYLTNDSQGTGNRTPSDTRYISVSWNNYANAIRAEAVGTSTTRANIVNADHGLNVTLIYEIERISSNRATFRVFDNSQQLLGQTTVDLTGKDIGDDLYISLYAGSASITFDNVRINQPIPEPATIGLLMLGFGFLRRRRK